MTYTETVTFVAGLLIGAQGMAFWFMLLDMRDARRDQARQHRARRRAAGDQFLSSFRVYRLESRTALAEPHPAEVLEASVRGCELSVYAALDRIDNIARREGL